jgi:hypothetical protein
VLLVLAAVVAGCGADRNGYVADNERLLAELPRFPNSTRLSVQHLEIEQTLGDSEIGLWAAGYSTHVQFRVPRTVSGEDVVRFCNRQLRQGGWQGRISHVDGIPVACYVRGGAFVSILTDGMDRRFPGIWSFEIGVNHDGGAPSLC